MDAQIIIKLRKQYQNAIKRRDNILSQYEGSFDNLKARYLEYRKVCHDKNEYNHCITCQLSYIEILYFASQAHRMKSNTDVYKKDNLAYM